MGFHISFPSPNPSPQFVHCLCQDRVSDFQSNPTSSSLPVFTDTPLWDIADFYFIFYSFFLTRECWVSPLGKFPPPPTFGSDSLYWVDANDCLFLFPSSSMVLHVGIGLCSAAKDDLPATPFDDLSASHSWLHFCLVFSCQIYDDND